MMKRAIKIVLVVLPSVFLFGILSVYLISSILMLGSEKLLEEENYEEENVYKYISLDPISNSTKFGFVSLGEHIVEKYMSYEDQGSYHLITNFESTNFYCTGKCFCDQKRRNSGSIVVKSAGYLLAAISSLSAFQFAKDQFNLDCEEKLKSSDCDLSSVRSKVDSCEKIEEVTKSTEKKKVIESREDETRGFMCKALKYAHQFDCEKLKTESEVYITIEGTWMMKKREKRIKFADASRNDFQKKHLNRFCTSNSKRDIYQMTKGDRIRATLCVGSGSGVDHIECVQVYP